MIFSWSLLALLSFSAIQVTSTPSKRTYDTHDYYALEHFSDGKSFGASLDEVATALGVEVVEQVGVFKDVWLVRAEKPTESLGSREESDDVVLSNFERLRVQATSLTAPRSEDTLLAKRVVWSVTFLERQDLHELVKRVPLSVAPPSIKRSTSKEVADRLHLHDPLFKHQCMAVRLGKYSGSLGVCARKYVFCAKTILMYAEKFFSRNIYITCAEK